MDARAEKIVLFRYGLIARLVLETPPREGLHRRAREIVGRYYGIPCSKRDAASVDTLLLGRSATVTLASKLWFPSRARNAASPAPSRRMVYQQASVQHWNKGGCVERFFKDSKAIQRFRSGPLGPQIQELAEELTQDGYTRCSVRIKIRTADHFSRWLKRRRTPLGEITPKHARLYTDRHGCKRSGDPETLGRLLRILATRGLIAGPEPKPAKTPSESAVDTYAEYLRQEHGLAASTIVYHRRFIARFLASRFGSGRLELSALQASDVITFVQQEAARVASVSAKQLTTALRSFLAYARFCGAISRDLAVAVPTVANWSLSGIPKTLTREQVKRVLAGCNRQTATGRRDYAVLLLLARLGLRGGEVSKLSLDDIDWAAGTLSVHGKNGKLSKLPLPKDVGQAIAAYLRLGRPSAPTRAVFLRGRPPVGALRGAVAVSVIVGHALARASVESASKGAHQFRHTLATEMLREGASLAEVGEVLRHENTKTTTIYAKVDLPALRPLAQPWPEGVK
jgi:integrase/recombinase XerD